MPFQVPESASKVKNTLPIHLEAYRLKRSNQQGRILKKEETYKEIASGAGISHHAVKQMLKGISVPSLHVALKLSKFLQVPTDELFTLKEEV